MPSLALNLKAAETIGQLQAKFAGRQGIWLVGGAVRDLIRGEQPVEFDLAIDPKQLDSNAATFAVELGELSATYPEFGTATSVAADGIKFDVAEIRLEKYLQPGALPLVSAAETIEQDLARRDFTVNAMAVSLTDQQLEIIDPFGGYDDLSNGVCRQLSDVLFIDDPTRAWRLIRYCSRLNLYPDPSTLAALASTDPSVVSRDRNRNELRMLLAEPDLRSALSLLNQLTPMLVPRGFIDQDARFFSAEKALSVASHLDQLTKASLRFAAWCWDVDTVELLRWQSICGEVPNLERTLNARELLPRTSYLPVTSNSELAAIYRKIPVETVALDGAIGADRYLRSLATVKLNIDGTALLAKGFHQGPTIGQALDATLNAKLDGVLDRSEIDFAVEYLQNLERCLASEDGD